MKKAAWSILFTLLAITASYAQPTYVYTDPEKKYKEIKEYIAREEYGLAYPLIKDLLQQYPENKASDQAYLYEDLRYYQLLCDLQLQLPIAESAARSFIYAVNNEPRRQILAFHLAHYYFLKNDFNNAIEYFDLAGYTNLSNEQIADAKFEKAYAYFNLKQFEQARPLFDEIHQLPENKYYLPANYYYGFICYYNKQYDEALKSFKLVESQEAYKGVVPYYIAEIYYFQGKKEEALRYGESVLKNGGAHYYVLQLKLLMGQLYFEKQQYSKALPLLEEYVNGSDKVSKEVLYELSFCYYKDNQVQKAIDGFKQLSNERDSMGQNSMYLLGDLYLKTNQKANARNAFQYSAYNSSNKVQQRVSRFNYAKLSYELGYQDVALNEMKKYLQDYPGSENETEAKEILVSLLANTNNYADAIQLYESLKPPTPAMQKVYPRILYGRSIELINDQQLIQADALLDKLLGLTNNNSLDGYAQFWKGEIAYRQNRYDDAIRNMNLFLASGLPASGEANAINARYVSGYSWFQKENYKNALPAFEAIATKLPANASNIEQDAYVRAADCYFMNRDFAKAGTMYDAVINGAFPASDYATYQKAMIGGVKSSAEKIRILGTLNKLYPNSNLLPDANMEIAQTYMADEKFSNAIPYLEGLLNNNQAGGLKPKAYLKLGLAYYNMNQNKNALNYYQQLVQKYPQSAEAAEALSIMRDIYVEEGRPNDYVELMKQNGVQVSVTEADSLQFTSAMIKYNNGDCTAAIQSLGEYINRYPDGHYALEAHANRGTCYQKNKDWNNALADYAWVSGKGVSRFYEKATLEAARIAYFELKDYAKARPFFESLHQNTSNQDNQLEALRGLVRCYYQLKDYSTANDIARELLTKKGINSDDKAVANLVLGKSQQRANDCAAAIASFKAVAAVNRTAWGAEARYEMAACQFGMNNLTAAEKAAMSVIKETGSYDLWVTQSYILLGDIFMKQKDYFNAKATYESVASNAVIPELKAEAQRKLDQAIAEEKSQSKLNN